MWGIWELRTAKWWRQGVEFYPDATFTERAEADKWCERLSGWFGPHFEVRAYQ